MRVGKDVQGLLRQEQIGLRRSGKIEPGPVNRRSGLDCSTSLFDGIGKADYLSPPKSRAGDYSPALLPSPHPQQPIRISEGDPAITLLSFWRAPERTLPATSSGPNHAPPRAVFLTATIIPIWVLAQPLFLRGLQNLPFNRRLFALTVRLFPSTLYEPSVILSAGCSFAEPQDRLREGSRAVLRA